MKILIAADMEGVTGVVNWDQVTPGHAEYARFRPWLRRLQPTVSTLSCSTGPA